MKSVVLSTPEAEYVAVSEVVKEIKVLYQMLRSMEIKVPLYIKVQVDSVGTIWLANNGLLPELCITFHLHYISFALHFICI